MADTPTTTHIADLRPDPVNARKHNPRNIGMIAESLQRYGPGRSITIDEHNMILAGHGVVEAAMQIGIEYVRVYDRTTGEMEPPPPNGAQYITAVRISDLTPEQKKLYAIADNRTTDLSTFDADVLQAFIDDGLDLEQFWFPEELTEVLAVTPINYRRRILQSIAGSTRPGGAVVLVEKLIGENDLTDRIMVNRYHRMKADNGYTQEEIDRKALALEGVQVPVSASWNEDLLRDAGFSKIECFWRWMNFAGWVGVK